jgi:hypothetical protein
MFGLGIYLADQSVKSHRYVSNPQNGFYKMMKCRVALGNSLNIRGHLKKGDALHDLTVPTDDVCDNFDMLDAVNMCKEGYESFSVIGLGGAAQTGLSVINTEYIVFATAQVLPLYEITYKI